MVFAFYSLRSYGWLMSYYNSATEVVFFFFGVHVRKIMEKTSVLTFMNVHWCKSAALAKETHYFL